MFVDQVTLEYWWRVQGERCLGLIAELYWMSWWTALVVRGFLDPGRGWSVGIIAVFCLDWMRQNHKNSQCGFSGGIPHEFNKL